jgi:hypothetical protein
MAHEEQVVGVVVSESEVVAIDSCATLLQQQEPLRAWSKSCTLLRDRPGAQRALVVGVHKRDAQVASAESVHLGPRSTVPRAACAVKSHGLARSRV